MVALRFRNHLFIGLSLTTLLLTSVFLYEFTTLFRKNAVDSLIEYGETITADTAITATDYILTEDFAPLQEYAEEFANRSKVKEVVIADSNGIVLADSSRKMFGSPLADCKHLSSATYSKAHIREKEMELHVLSLITISSTNIGYTRVAISLEEVFSEIAAIKKKMLMLGFFFWIASVFIGMFITRMITRPISRMLDLTSKITKGDFSSITLKKGPVDEINKFSHALSIMSTVIRDREAKLKETLENLDLKVNERTAALNTKVEELERTRNELIQSEKMASLGRLVAGFAHEINTPIGVAVGAASQIEISVGTLAKMLDQEEVEEEELLDIFASIQEGTDLSLANLRRAAALVSSFKRTAIDQTKEESRFFNVSETINDVVSSLHNKFKRTDIRISIDCQKDLNFFGVPGALDQIITNLMVNSLLHGFDNGKSSGEIAISVTYDNEQLTIIYQDNGKGMDEKALKLIFEPFYTTARDEGGSGLGLFICYNLLTTRLKGSIHCESKPGEGARFEITYPVSKSNAGD